LSPPGSPSLLTNVESPGWGSLTCAYTGVGVQCLVETSDTGWAFWVTRLSLARSDAKGRLSALLLAGPDRQIQELLHTPELPRKRHECQKALRKLE
jgi:hypothetical protein